MPTISLVDSTESRYVQPPKERMKQLRLNMLVHSYIYYHLNSNIISDHEWQRRADELAQLQAKHPTQIGCYDEDFKGWDGSTGYHLPTDFWISSKATALLKQYQPKPLRRRVQLQTEDKPIPQRPTRKVII